MSWLLLQTKSLRKDGGLTCLVLFLSIIELSNVLAELSWALVWELLVKLESVWLVWIEGVSVWKTSRIEVKSNGVGDVTIGKKNWNWALEVLSLKWKGKCCSWNMTSVEIEISKVEIFSTF